MRTFFVICAIALTGCSFTAAGNFKECANDTDCGALGVCSHNYCLTMPPGCRRENAGGSVDPFREETRIPIAALLPITDSSGGVDESEVRGIEAMRLAVSEVNDAKGLDNRHFALFVCDTSAPDGGKRGVEQLEWMVKNLETPAVLSSGSDLMLDLSGNEVRKSAGTLLMSATATASALSKRFETEGNIWRIAPPDSEQSRVMLNVVRSDFPDAGTRVDVIYETSQYGQGFGNDLSTQLTEAGYESTGRRFVRGDSTGFINLARELANSTPRAAVFIGFPPDLRTLLTEAQTQQLPELAADAGFRWFLGDAAKDPAITLGAPGARLNGSYGTAPAQGIGAAFPTFRDAYKARYGMDPLTFSYTSHSYDAAWVVMLSAAWAAQNGQAITGARMGEGLTKMQASFPATPLRADKWIALSDDLKRGTTVNIEGASGPLDFDLDAGVARSSYEVWQVFNGDIRVVRIVPP